MRLQMGLYLLGFFFQTCCIPPLWLQPNVVNGIPAAPAPAQGLGWCKRVYRIVVSMFDDWFTKPSYRPFLLGVVAATTTSIATASFSFVTVYFAEDYTTMGADAP